MKSPITGKEMKLEKELRKMTFRKEEFDVIFHFYLCEDSGEKFESEELAEVNVNQIHNQYRVKHKLPFSDEIKNTRDKYGLSAAKMAEVLGFGVNMYRSYEGGEIPSSSNARLIQLAKDPQEFKKLVNLSGIFEGKELQRIYNRIDELIKEEDHQCYFDKVTFLMGDNTPNVYTGYKKPDLEKFFHIVLYFADSLKPFKTKLNKLLFYTDFFHFKKTCFSISGARYRAIDLGPVPNNFQSLFEAATTEGYVNIEYIHFDNGIGEKFLPNDNMHFDHDLFSVEEISTLEEVKRTFEKTDTKNIIDLSHVESAWARNQEHRKLISYNESFNLVNM